MTITRAIKFPEYSAADRATTAVFYGDARFVGTQFAGAVWFEATQFNGDARFDGAQFSRDARFAGARFDPRNNRCIRPGQTAPTCSAGGMSAPHPPARRRGGGPLDPGAAVPSAPLGHLAEPAADAAHVVAACRVRGWAAVTDGTAAVHAIDPRIEVKLLRRQA